MDVRPGEPERLGVTRLQRDLNFAAAVPENRDCSLLLYKKGSDKIEQEIPFTEEMRFGDVCAVRISQFPADTYEYNYQIDGKVVQDPYAVQLTGREHWGERPEEGKEVRCVPETGHFSWKDDRPLKLPYEECILYTTHVRGFTMDPSAKVRHPGTFAGIREKIPYLKGMGITQLELMPVYEFFEWSVGPPQKKHQPVPKGYFDKINYWGYTQAQYFAPKTAYSASGNPVQELKELVRALHKNGIELILEFYFAERTSPNLIMDCIHYWVKEYHIDGVHVNCAVAPLRALALDPVLSRTKIMSEYFPLDQIFAEKEVPVYRRLAAYNDDFLIKARRFLRGDENMTGQIAESIRRNPATCTTINYLASHNGFTLNDAVSYSSKHNEDNGEDNRDGSNYNYGCNYGVEGPTTSRRIQKLRSRQLRNAFLLLLLSQGVPAIYGGDEMGNSQQGNNNVYCQDNPLSWIQWGKSSVNRKLQQFVRETISFRKAHPAFGQASEYQMRDLKSHGIPDLSYHGKKAWYGDFENESRQIGILYAGAYTGEDTLYILYNMDAIVHELALPTLPGKEQWYLLADTGREDVFLKEREKPLPRKQKMILVEPHTILILEGAKYETD